MAAVALQSAAIRPDERGYKKFWRHASQDASTWGMLVGNFKSYQRWVSLAPQFSKSRGLG